MKFGTKDFDDWSWMPVKFTADGDNSCPVFYVEDVPRDTLSLAILCHDPDATNKVPWIHWIAWNISPNTKSISDGNMIHGIINGLNSFGNTGYRGPSPSPGSGRHRYVFTLYALKKLVDPSNLKIYEEIDHLLMESSLTTATWTGLYERNLS